MERLRALRKSKQLYQKDVAAFLGVDRTTYVKYENGTSEPDFDTLTRLANYFNVTVDYLLGRTDLPTYAETPSYDLNPTKQAILEQLELLSDDQLKATLAFITVLLNA